MNAAIATNLLTLNREFYTRFGESFAETRRRLQPGVKRILETLSGHETILDLGCGNGAFARALAKRRHRGRYFGLDFSLTLLREAELELGELAAQFMEVDLARLSHDRDHRSAISGPWDVVTAFAVLHHIPGVELRLETLKTVRELIAGDGRFILSNWQFLNSERLKARIKPWEAVGIPGSEVDAGDYLLDWRRDGDGLRYVHAFTSQELSALAGRSRFDVVDAFLSDGEGGKLGLYQVWVPL